MSRKPLSREPNPGPRRLPHTPKLGDSESDGSRPHVPIFASILLKPAITPQGGGIGHPGVQASLKREKMAKTFLGPSTLWSFADLAFLN